MIDAIWNFQFNSLLAVFLYWSPAALCLYGYTIRTWTQYKSDIAKRLEAEKTEKGYYHPSLRIGDLVCRSIVTLLPIANLWAACFDVFPEVFRKLGEFISRALDQPLVPSRK